MKPFRKFNMGYIFLTVLFFCMTLSSNPALAENQSYTNILTWWGYLDHLSPAELKKIDQQCHTTISYDDYYSNDQFIDRFKNSPAHYDIIIFSDTIYKSIENKIDLPNSNLYLEANEYNPIIRKHYINLHLPHNVVFFIHALTGFLYNPETIKISQSDSIANIYRKAKGNIVVIINDPVEANFLIGLSINNGKKNISTYKNYLTWENFQQLFQNDHVIITNSPQKIVRLNNFSFAFEWSGDAIDLVNHSHGNLKFMVYPRLSYVSTDLLAELNAKSTTNCVAHALTTKRFLANIQNTNFYFSPYGDDSSSTNKDFINVFNQTFNNLPNLLWNTSLTNKELEELKKSWQYIQFKIAEQEKNT
jgi:hypothetical protein